MVMYDAQYYAAIKRRLAMGGRAVDAERVKTPVVPRELCEAKPVLVAAPPPSGLLPRSKMPSMPPRVRAIINMVCDDYGINYEDLVGVSRLKKYMQPRTEVAIALREEIQLSTKQIGRILHRDHSTIVHTLHDGKRTEYARQQWVRRRTEGAERLAGRLPNPELGHQSIVAQSCGQTPSQPRQEVYGDTLSLGADLQPGLYGKTAA